VHLNIPPKLLDYAKLIRDRFDMFASQILRFLLGLLLSSSLINAQTSQCSHPKILSALQAHSSDGSDFFCRQLLATVSTIGTLDYDPTLVFYETSTDTQSTDTVYVFASTTTKERVTSTSFSSLTRRPTDFVKPLPSYVQQYSTAAVSKACSCYVGHGETYTQFRSCEPTSTTTYSTTLTYTVGVPGKETVTFTGTSTRTKLKYTTAAYPSNCPDADGIDYVASDHSLWDRGCKTGVRSPLEVFGKIPTYSY
jgi:hypothetical protein